MKFKGEVVLEYLRPSRILRMSGKTTAGVSSKAEIAVENPRHFLLELATCFQQEQVNPPSTLDVIPIRHLQMGVISDRLGTGGVGAMFAISIADVKLHFVAPLEHLERSKIPAIERCFRELDELMQPGSAGVQRH